MPQRTLSLAERLGIPPADIERVTGRYKKPSSLEEARKSYLNVERHSKDKSRLLSQLEYWILEELRKAKTPEEHRCLHGQTPEESRMILDVNLGWDRSVRKQLSSYGKGRNKSAKKAWEIFRASRPTSYEWFSARDEFERVLKSDMARAKKGCYIGLMFELIEILQIREERDQLEKLLIRHVKTFEDQRRLKPLISSRENQDAFIRKVAKLR